MDVDVPEKKPQGSCVCHESHCVIVKQVDDCIIWNHLHLHYPARNQQCQCHLIVCKEQIAMYLYTSITIDGSRVCIWFFNNVLAKITSSR